MSPQRITRGCQRKAIDFPKDLHDKIEQLAAEPPAISFSEWVRRVCAAYAKVPLASAKDRARKRVTINGDPSHRYRKRTVVDDD